VPTNDHGVPTGVHFTYSLYQAAGNLLLVRVAPGGMEIDSGFGKTDVSAWEGDFADVKLTCAKSVRYTDILTRSTCGQGTQGAGNALNYNAPATLSMWMYELVSGNVQQWATDTMSSLGGQQ
jgi:hypothetical protein